MRVFAVSDVHVDYAENLAWIPSLDHKEYGNDILILAGDVTYKMPRITHALYFTSTRISNLIDFLSALIVFIDYDFSHESYD